MNIALEALGNKKHSFCFTSKTRNRTMHSKCGQIHANDVSVGRTIYNADKIIISVYCPHVSYLFNTVDLLCSTCNAIRIVFVISNLHTNRVEFEAQIYIYWFHCTCVWLFFFILPLCRCKLYTHCVFKSDESDSMSVSLKSESDCQQYILID